MRAKLAAQVCSTCFSAFIGVQHLLQMTGYARPIKQEGTSSSQNSSTQGPAILASSSQQSAQLQLPVLTPLSSSASYIYSSQPHTSRDQVDFQADASPSILPTSRRRPRPASQEAPPATRVLRAACVAELTFSFTGMIGTAMVIHDQALRENFHVVFWTIAPQRAAQVASFCWMGTLALYIAMRQRASFDVAVAHAVIWLLAILYWVLVVIAAYTRSDVVEQAGTVFWMVFAGSNWLLVTTCWAVFMRRWTQQPSRQRGAFVVAKLLSYVVAFLVFVTPIVILHAVIGVDDKDQASLAHTVTSFLMALWPTANAIVYLTKPFLFERCFKDTRETAVDQDIVIPWHANDGCVGRTDRFATATTSSDQSERSFRRGGRAMTQMPLSMTRHELKGLEVGEKIGEGMAVVYKGKWRGADVAVKMKSLMIDPDEDLDEFQDACNREIEEEAAVMKNLCHPNIVLFMEAGFYKRSICIISEYCSRGSLRDVLQRARGDQALSWSTKVRLALGIAYGIQYLHNSNPPMIHRDLKSPNVLVDDSWHAKIADFGTLRFAEIVSSVKRSTEVHTRASPSKPDQSMVMTGLVGTTRWMAPEVIRGDKIYTSKVDIYSLGLILWELIEGKLPFETTRWNHEIEDYVLRDIRPVIQGELCPMRWRSLIMGCWQTDPAQRPTIQQVITTLQRIAREETLDTSAPRITDITSFYSSNLSERSNTSFLGTSMASLSSSLASSNASMMHQDHRSKASRVRGREQNLSLLSVGESEQFDEGDEDVMLEMNSYFGDEGNFLTDDAVILEARHSDLEADDNDQKELIAI
ncbi:hypothetical protein Poli38472_003000 [Pythium oligandrum]|uniref:Protein kinase domain-containing protein n=1 Tax=Pythium oligandrum TaxID=41045 RepID=A0A8K1FBB0_PYTOL|nr:hypothetical protein Poli38472_003000 [Pythium oligandrum]|eukprot:TMW57075.1 hypothetical protein Poli38472_003000 [Pythium oligandrum]